MRWWQRRRVQVAGTHAAGPKAKEIQQRVTAAIEVPEFGTGPDPRPWIVMPNVDEWPLPALDAGGTYPVAMRFGWVRLPHQAERAMPYAAHDVGPMSGQVG